MTTEIRRTKMQLEDETKALINRSNQLHAALMEQKKIQAAFWDRFHGASKKLHEVSDAFAASLISKEEWAAFYVEWQKIREEDPPKPPDATDWTIAKEEAMMAVAQDAGLRLRIDGL